MSTFAESSAVSVVQGSAASGIILCLDKHLPARVALLFYSLGKPTGCL